MVKIKLDDCVVDMEVGTGASVSLMSENTFKTLWPGRSLYTECIYSYISFFYWGFASNQK